jgi:uncharacterized protein (TIGR02302 family)
MSRLEQLLRRYSLIMLIERLLRLCAGLLTIALFFLAVSWLDLWRIAPLAIRILGGAFFLFLALFLIVREIVQGPPKQSAVIKRLDLQAPPGLLPAQSLLDRLANPATDPKTPAFWALHRAKLHIALEKMPVAWPKTDLPRFDPFALRSFALVCAVAAAFVAGDDKIPRLRAAFNWRLADSLRAGERIEAWFDPPAYTMRAALMLPSQSGVLSVPINSILRMTPDTAQVAIEDGFVMLADRDGSAQTEQKPTYKLTNSGHFALSDGRAFEIIPIVDQPPIISLIEPIRQNELGSMIIEYMADDDYGVVSIDAAFSLRAHGDRALYDAPRVALTNPGGGKNNEPLQATIDLAESPFAGAQLDMRLIAKDAGENIGVSKTIKVILPQRFFKKPLARSLIEQRRNLALHPEMRVNVVRALDSLSLAPEIFETTAAVYLGLRTARNSLDGKRSDDELRSVVDLLWVIALEVEAGKSVQAEKELRASEKALREAIQNHEDDYTLSQRLEELSQALNNLINELTADSNDNNSSQSSGDDNEAVTKQQIHNLLENLHDALKSGDRAEAEKLLAELQEMMENLQASAGKDTDGSGQQNSAQQLSELDQLSKEEQALRDETLEAARETEVMKPQQSEREENQKKKNNMDTIRQRQEALRKRLERTQDNWQNDDPESASELEKARKSMKEAEEALGPKDEDLERALESQQEALETLRETADALSEKLRAQQEGGAPGARNGQRRQGMGRDPLGRTSGGQRFTKEKYDPLGLPPAQRAHQLQEELRRRLGQPERPAQELEYLQRLLKP